MRKLPKGSAAGETQPAGRGRDIVGAQGEGKVVPFPEHRARRPDMDNPLAVRCRKSGRWVEFPFRAERDAAGVEILWVRVRSRGKDGRPRTVCELELAWEDVWHALMHVGPPY